MLSIDVYQEMYHLAQKVEQNTTILEIALLMVLEQSH
jgi:hypothetical protein